MKKSFYWYCVLSLFSVFVFIDFHHAEAAQITGEKSETGLLERFSCSSIGNDLTGSFLVSKGKGGTGGTGSGSGYGNGGGRGNSGSGTGKNGSGKASGFGAKDGSGTGSGLRDGSGNGNKSGTCTQNR